MASTATGRIVTPASTQRWPVRPAGAARRRRIDRSSRCPSGARPRRSRGIDSADVDGDAALVPPARGADHMRLFGVAAAGTRAAGGDVELPGRGAVAARLGFRLLLLGDGHRSRILPCEPGEAT